jgi:hypothetical protein
MNLFKKLVPTALSIFIISSSISVAQAETNPANDYVEKSTSNSVLMEAKNKLSSPSLAKFSYNLDKIIPYPKELDNVSRDLNWEDSEAQTLFVGLN